MCVFVIVVLACVRVFVFGVRVMIMCVQFIFSSFSIGGWLGLT